MFKEIAITSDEIKEGVEKIFEVRPYMDRVTEFAKELFKREVFDSESRWNHFEKINVLSKNKIEIVYTYGPINSDMEYWDTIIVKII